MTSSKIFFYFCLSFIVGVFAESVIFIPRLLMLGFLILGLTLISVLWPFKKLVVLGFCIIFGVLGIWRSSAVETKYADSEIKKYNNSDTFKIIIGKVAGDPEIRDSSIKLLLETESLDMINLNEKKRGQNRILITASLYPEYQYGDKLKITGKLESPPVFSAQGGPASGWEGFNYKNYLEKSGIFSVMSWPKIEKINGKENLNIRYLIYSRILILKEKFRQAIYQNLSPPQSSILSAMILGDNSALSSDLKTKLNVTGVRHVIAVSGMHVVILTAILMSLLLALGFWRGQAFYFSVILILFFIILTGLQPSGIRAGIMAGFLLLGQKLGRQATNSRSLVIAAAFMLFFNPMLLLSDIGFQLSFLAVLGIIYLSPIIKSWLKFFPEEKIVGLKSILATTFAAQIFTLPILVYNFGNISLVSPITNILILPLVYWMMIFGFLLVVFGSVWQPLGWGLMIPAWFLITYLIKVVDFFSGPWAAKTIQNVHWLWLIAFYLILGALVYWLNKKSKLKFLDY